VGPECVFIDLPKFLRISKAAVGTAGTMVYGQNVDFALLDDAVRDAIWSNDDFPQRSVVKLRHETAGLWKVAKAVDSR
jgi:hypothetical protein